MNDNNPKPKSNNISQIFYALSCIEEKLDNILSVVCSRMDRYEDGLVTSMANLTDKVSDAMETRLDSLGRLTGQDPQRLISVKEASKMMSRSEFCIRKDISSGKIPAKKVGRGYFIVLSDLQKIISSNSIHE